MFRIVNNKSFKKSLRKLERSGMMSAGVRNDLRDIFDALARRAPLPAWCRDHQLQGNLHKFRECHIRGDLLLVYEVKEEKELIVLDDIGTHSELFG